MRPLVSSALYPESQAMIRIKVPLLPSKQKESFPPPPKIPSGKKKKKLANFIVQKHNKKKKTKLQNFPRPKGGFSWHSMMSENKFRNHYLIEGLPM